MNNENRVTRVNWRNAMKDAAWYRKGGVCRKPSLGKAADCLNFASACRRAYVEDMRQEWGNQYPKYDIPIHLTRGIL